MEDFRGRCGAFDGEEISPVSRLDEDGADVLRNEQSPVKPADANCQPAARRLVQYFQIASDDLGPVGILCRPRTGGKARVTAADNDTAAERRKAELPNVGIWIYTDKAVVRYINPPWGWSDERAEFLNPDSPAVTRYAKRLGLKLREAALIEIGRRRRIAELKRREREAFLARRDGGR